MEKKVMMRVTTSPLKQLLPLLVAAQFLAAPIPGKLL
jgi:hypothetical protein